MYRDDSILDEVKKVILSFSEYQRLELIKYSEKHLKDTKNNKIELLGVKGSINNKKGL